MNGMTWQHKNNTLWAGAAKVPIFLKSNLHPHPRKRRWGMFYSSTMFYNWHIKEAKYKLMGIRRGKSKEF